MKKLLIASSLFLLFFTSNAQIDKIAGGLAFSSGVDFNSNSTGNPGVFAKAYVGVVKRIHLVPSIVVFTPGEAGSSFTSDIRKNYMFHGDLDVQYGLFREDKLKLIGFAGLNTTGIISKVDENTNLENVSETHFGVNLGTAVEMNVDNSFDAVLSAKYILSEFDEFVISLGVIYRFDSRKRRGW